MHNITELNRRFGINGVAEVVPGEGSLPKVRLNSLSTGEMYLHGAQVTSWRPVESEEVLFLSPHSQWQEGKAIRGGVPICFPWFRGKADDPEAPAHGVVRTRTWQLQSIMDGEGGVTVSMVAESDDVTRRWWPGDFRVVHRATFGKELRLELEVTNTGTLRFRFEEALHSYFRVGDVRQARVQGLDGVHYLDNLAGNVEEVQTGAIALDAAADRAYINTSSGLELSDPGLCRQILLSKENSETTVVWNPWQEGARALPDLGEDEWRHMLCIEASNVMGSAVNLEPGAQHVIKATIRVA